MNLAVTPAGIPPAGATPPSLAQFRIASHVQVLILHSVRDGQEPQLSRQTQAQALASAW